ncbi:MAG: PRC-barrel domain containing protein [Phycisphaerae bacterium]|nr:PRC-barrel domain containing protein [Phycisphaerae bacterium]
MDRTRWFWTSLFLVGGALFTLVAVPVVGQQQAQSDQPERQGEFQPLLQKASHLIGLKVQNPAGEDLGRIDDLVLSANEDRVSYAVLARGGFLGIGDKYFAIPWSALTMSAANDAMVLDVEKDRLKAAPGFNKDNWPNMGDPRWSQGVHQFYQEESQQYRENQPTNGDVSAEAETADQPGQRTTVAKDKMEFRRLSKVIGTEVKNLEGVSLGDVENVVIDMHEGRLVYAILSWGGILGIGEELAAAPWSALEARPRLDTFRLDVTKNSLKSIAYNEGDAPDLSNPAYARRIHSHFDQEPYWQVFGYVEGDGTLSSEPWLPGSTYNENFDPEQIQTIRGTIQSVGTFRPDTNALPGLRLRVKTTDGGTVTVYAGPEAYAHRQGIEFYYGDRVTVKGSSTKVNGRSVLMAGQIQKGDQTLELRSPTGEPKWTTEDLRAVPARERQAQREAQKQHPQKDANK